MQISISTSSVSIPVSSIFQQSHPLFKAIEKGDEQEILNLTQKDGDNPFKKDLLLFDFKELVQELPKLVKCLSEQSLSLEARYRAANMLRRMLFQVVRQQPNLVDQRALFPLESLYSSFESYLPTLFEVIVCHELIKVAIQNQGDQALCFKNICDKMHERGLLKETSLPLEAKKTKEAVQQFFQSKEMLFSQVDVNESMKAVENSEKMLLFKNLMIAEKKTNEIEREFKRKPSLDLAKTWEKSILSLHIHSKMISSFDALVKDLAVPGHAAVILQAYVDSIKIYPPQIEEALDVISQQLQTSFLEKQKEDLEDEFKDFCCPITRALMEEPVIAEDDHSYEKRAIEQHLQISSISPMTGLKIGPKLRPNFTLGKAIQTIKEQQAKILKRGRNPEENLNKKLKIPAESLASSLNKDAQASPLNEQKEMQKKLYLEGIKFNPSDASAYVNLGKILEPNEKIKLLNEIEMTAQQLFLKAIACSPTFILAYFNLAETLPLNGSVKLLNETFMTKQELYLKVIKLDPHYLPAYVSLANTLAPGKKVQLPNGHEKTAQQLYLEVIQSNPQYGLAYFSLANLLPMGGSIKLLNGHYRTKQELYVKAIAIDPSLNGAYANLALTLVRGEKIKLLDGTIMTNQDLFLKAVHLNPALDFVYVNLGNTLGRGEKIKLLDGTIMTNQDLFLKAIHLNPAFGHAYANLGNTLVRGEKIKLLDGTIMTNQDLYILAIHLNPTLDFTYVNLANTLSRSEKVRLLDRTEVTSQQLYLKAIELNPSRGIVYGNLANTLAFGGSIKLSNGTEITKQELYLKAIHLNPSISSVYVNLAATLVANETIKLLDGTEMTKQQLVLKAAQLTNSNASS